MRAPMPGKSLAKRGPFRERDSAVRTIGLGDLTHTHAAGCGLPCRQDAMLSSVPGTFGTIKDWACDLWMSICDLGSWPS